MAKSVPPLCPRCLGSRCDCIDSNTYERNIYICKDCGVEWNQIAPQSLQSGQDPQITFSNQTVSTCFRDCGVIPFHVTRESTFGNAVISTRSMEVDAFGVPLPEIVPKHEIEYKNLCDVCKMSIGEVRRGCYLHCFIEGDRLCAVCSKLLSYELQEFYPAPGNGLPARMRMTRIAKLLPKRFDKKEAITIYVCMGRFIRAYELMKQTCKTVHVPVPSFVEYQQ